MNLMILYAPYRQVNSSDSHNVRVERAPGLAKLQDILSHSDEHLGLRVFLIYCLKNILI